MRRFLRVSIGVVTGLLLGFSLLLTALRFVEIDQEWALALTSASAYALVGYVVTLLVCLLMVRGARRRVVPVLGAVLSLALVLAHLAWVAPWLTGDDAKTTSLTVMSSNLEVGQGDPADVVRAARRADVLVLEEVTPGELAALEDRGLGSRLRYHAGTAVPGVRGTMVFSRYALSDQQSLDLGNGGLTVRVAAPRPFRLYAVHTAMLLSTPRRWHDDLALLRARLAKDVAKGPVLAVGDWNATYSHVPMRRVLDAGLRDSAEASASWAPTWPTRWRKPWLRPLFAIDHVLVSDQFAAVRVSTAEVEHTDHLAVVAQLDYR